MFSALFVLLFLGSLMLNLLLLAAVAMAAAGSQRHLQEKFVSHNSRATDNKVAIITVEGVISETEDGFIKRQIDCVAKDENVKAVVLRVDSPGGTVSASDYLYHHLCKMKAAGKRQIPVVVSMGGIAASGGYYVSMAVGHNPDTIFAEPTTFTGSIGVIFPHFDLAGLMDKIGVKEDATVSGPLKEMGSPTCAMTPEEKKIFQGLVDESFAGFKEIVRAGRARFAKNPDALDKLATGQVFTAQQAKAAGLIDRIGFLEEAVDRAIELAKLDEKHVEVIRYTPEPGLASLLLGRTKRRPRHARPPHAAGPVHAAGLLPLYLAAGPGRHGEVELRPFPLGLIRLAAAASGRGGGPGRLLAVLVAIKHRPQLLLHIFPGQAHEAVALLVVQSVLEEMGQLLVEVGPQRAGAAAGRRLLPRRLANPLRDHLPLLGSRFSFQSCAGLGRNPAAQIGQLAAAQQAQRRRVDLPPSLIEREQHGAVPRGGAQLGKLLLAFLGEHGQQPGGVLLRVAVDPTHDRLAVLGTELSGGLFFLQVLDVLDPLWRRQFLQRRLLIGRQPGKPLAIVRQHVAQMRGLGVALQLLVQLPHPLLLGRRELLELLLPVPQLVFLDGSHAFDPRACAGHDSASSLPPASPSSGKSFARASSRRNSRLSISRY